MHFKIGGEEKVMIRQQVLRKRRKYHQWVSNQTIEDYALRFTAKEGRRWSLAQVVVTSLGAITFLVLEVFGATLLLSYGFNNLVIALIIVVILIFTLSLPISYYAARYGLDIDLLTRGAGFGYIGSTITSFIYAAFTFIFLALESVIMAVSMQVLCNIPIYISYIISAFVIIPIVTYGFTFISAFQRKTQLLWVILQLLPLICIAFDSQSDQKISLWMNFTALSPLSKNGFNIICIGMSISILLSLMTQIGEQVDLLRFLPQINKEISSVRWWISVILAGPAWILIGGLKILLGAFLAFIVFQKTGDRQLATEPVQFYLLGFSYITTSPTLLFIITSLFIILSQIKINIVNTYAGSIAWSNFFLRLTRYHPGRFIWIFLNTLIAFLLIILGIYRIIESVLMIYSIIAMGWIGTLIADLVINKPLGLSPKGIEFRRAKLHELNPVGIGSLIISVLFGILAYLNCFGEFLYAFSPLLTLLLTFVVTPFIAWYTKGKYYLANSKEEIEKIDNQCCICQFSFEKEDTNYCPFYEGTICSLCCSLDARCNDYCKKQENQTNQLNKIFKLHSKHWIIRHVPLQIWRFLGLFIVFSLVISLALFIIFVHLSHIEPSLREYTSQILINVFLLLIIILVIFTWLFLLTNKSREIAIEELNQQSERLISEIEEHKITSKKLEQAKNKADFANETKTKYLANLSHELRTPLNAMLGYAQLIEQSIDTSEINQRAVKVIRHSGEYLAHMIEGLLDISKIELGRFDITRNEINIQYFMLQIVSLFREQAQKKQINFVYQPSKNLPDIVIGDENRLRQILINLLSNAIKFTDEGSVILRFEYRNEIALFQIIDTGIGINSEDIERIFQPFERVSTPSNSRQGCGLGLTITSLLVNIMGGDLKVCSEPNVGTTFTLKLMLSQQYNLNAQSGILEQIVTKIDGNGSCIIVVDDDDIHRQLISDILSPLGFEIIPLPSALMVLNKCREKKIDLFLIDVSMPDMTGWQLVSQLHQNGYYQPIIMLSGEVNNGNVSPHEDYCTNIRYLIKPLRIYSLLTMINDLLNTKKVNDEIIEQPNINMNYITSKEMNNISLSEIESLINMAKLGYANGIKKELNHLIEENRISNSFYQSCLAHLDCFRFDLFIIQLEKVKNHV